MKKVSSWKEKIMLIQIFFCLFLALHHQLFSFAYLEKVWTHKGDKAKLTFLKESLFENLILQWALKMLSEKNPFHLLHQHIHQASHKIVFFDGLKYFYLSFDKTPKHQINK